MPNPKAIARLSSAARRDGVLTAFLVLAALKCGWGISRIRDLAFDDEAVYLFHGLKTAKLGLSDAARSPLYSAWYWVLGRFFRDPVTLYDVNWGLMLAALVTASYWGMRRLSVPALAAFLGAAWILVSRIPDIWPYPMYLAVALLWGVLALAPDGFRGIRGRIPVAALLRLGLGFLVASYLRPEFFPSFCIVTAWAGVRYCWCRFREGKLAPPGKAVVAPLVAAAILLVIIGVPYRGDRVHHAFGQHYARRIGGWERTGVSPWLDYREYLKPVFGETSSLGQAMMHNPRAFAGHLGLNIRELVRTIPDWLRPQATLPFPLSAAMAAVIALIQGLGLLEIGRSVAALLPWRGPKRRRRTSVERWLARHFEAVPVLSPWELVWLAGFLVPLLLAAVIVAPRSQTVFPLSLVLAVMGVRLLTFRLARAKVPWSHTALAGICLINVLPNRGGTFGIIPRQWDLEGRTAVRELRDLPLKKLERCLEPGYSWLAFAGHDCPFVSLMGMRVGEGLRSFLERERITVAVLDWHIFSDVRLKGDTWARRLQRGECKAAGEAGYQCDRLAGGRTVVLSRH